MLQALQTRSMGFNGRLLFIFGVPAVLVLILEGEPLRVLCGPAYYWVAFTLWFCLGSLFSSWKGGSIAVLWDFVRTALLMLFVVAGSIVTWRQCQWVIRTIALACVLNLASVWLLERSTAWGGRLGLEFGLVGNPNDFAGHLLLCLPCVLWVVLDSKSVILRLAAFGVMIAGIYAVLRTASRGAEIALAVEVLLFFFRGTARQRFALVCLAPIAIVGLMAILPNPVVSRLFSFTSGASEVSQEALGSSRARSYVLRKSIEYTGRFPIFGLGAGQFAAYEGQHNIVLGSHGYWHGAHNSFMSAAVEGGIPAGIFFLAAWVSAFRLLNSTHKQARKRENCKDIELMSLCMMIAVLGFMVAIAFLNFTFMFYGPTVGGISVAIWRAAKGEFEKRSLASRPDPPGASFSDSRRQPSAHRLKPFTPSLPFRGGNIVGGPR